MTDTATTQPGTRVRLTQEVDNYPTILAPKGATGTLMRIDEEGSYWVRLDQHHPELAEWNNELQIWDWSQDERNGPEHHPENYIEALPADDDERERADREQIAAAFEKIRSAALALNEVLLRNDRLNDTVPTNWPLGLSADEFAAECGAMIEHYRN